MTITDTQGATSMFPTANSIIFRNEDGEVLGWESTYDDAPDAELDYAEVVRNDPEPDSEDQCIEWDLHFSDGDGTDIDDLWECMYCSGKYMHWPAEDGSRTWSYARVTDEQYTVLRALDLHSQLRPRPPV